VKNPAKFTFNGDRPENRVPSARQLVYADARANPTGRLPDDTWLIPPASTSDAMTAVDSDGSGCGGETFVLRPQDLRDSFKPEEDTWYFPRVAGTFKERAGFHGCQMPEQLLGRIIRCCSNDGDLVLDPFSGSGTTLVVAKKLRRRYMGFDISADYVAAGHKRLETVRAGDPLKGSADPLRSAPKTEPHPKRASQAIRTRRPAQTAELPFRLEPGEDAAS
jgi:site-specific DNA-methyltransferase (adenine-specific)